MRQSEAGRPEDLEDLEDESGAADRDPLDMFVGRWRTEGEQHSGPVGPAARITATESYEWLTGRRFLIHRFDGCVGDGEAACVEIIGRYVEGGNPVHTYYNNGVVNEWRCHHLGRAWELTGTWTMGSQKMQVRCTIVVADDGQAMTGKWEHSPDGTSWHAFWDVRSTRIA